MTAEAVDEADRAPDGSLDEFPDEFPDDFPDFPDDIPGFPGGGEPGPDLNSVVLTLSPEGWLSTTNNISFTLQFSSDITYEGASIGSGTISTSSSGTTSGGTTTVKSIIWANNGRETSVLNLEFLTSPDATGGSVSISDFSLNGVSHPDKLNIPLTSRTIEYPNADPISDFTAISESSNLDSGVDTYSYVGPAPYHLELIADSSFSSTEFFV